jgi:Spy/CpxP family protein refolding chaperone
MKLRMAVGVCVMLLAAVVFVHAAETPDKPKKTGGGRLTQPWSKIATLNDEQKTKIREIHAKAVADKKAIDEKERADILALLTDEQKAEAQKLLDEQKAPKSAAAPATPEKEGDPSNAKKADEKKSTE